MRKTSLTTNAPAEIKHLAHYHGSCFERLTFFNSDRPIYLDDNYTVSRENSASTLKIMKVGQEIGGFGYEMELECSTIIDPTVLVNLLSTVYEKLFPHDLFRMERDGSLGGRSSAECVTQVMSKAFIRNHYKDFKSMWDEYFPAFGITTMNENCGMHCNLSLSLLGSDRPTQIENARKLGYMINNHYDLFKVAFHRVNSNVWCPRMNHDKDYWKTNSIDRFPISHDSCCVNMGHVSQGRLEIRLVGGQKNFACFRNTNETLWHIVEAVKKLSWNDLDDLAKIFKGCNNYVYDRLSTNCYRAGAISMETLEKIKPTVKTVQYV